jgi:hypothetical protein
MMPPADASLDATRDQLFAGLERRAAELDSLSARERNAEHAAEESAKRRFLLLDLVAAGIFDLEFELPAEFRTLRAYRQAALRVSEYLAGGERSSFNPDAAPEPVVGSPVSIDWFRFPQPGPGHLSPAEWLAYAENILTHAGVSGGQGEVLTRLGSQWWTLVWRRDDGIHPALVSANR